MRLERPEGLKADLRVLKADLINIWDRLEGAKYIALRCG
jgi:hypothetical protein